MFRTKLINIVSDGTPSLGPLGIAAGTDTAIIVKNFLVQDTSEKTLYFNSMTSQSALEDFATGTNYYGVCFGTYMRCCYVSSLDSHTAKMEPRGTEWYGPAISPSLGLQSLVFIWIDDIHC
jgi:hypothetical protein